MPRAEFRTITVTYPAKLAEILKEKNPDCRFCLLSGMGADRAEKSKVMFARDKGMIENYLSNIGFAAFHAFRPAYIYPTIKRKEPNYFYLIYRWIYPTVKWLGPAYSITSKEIAHAMFVVGMYGHDEEIVENRHILKVVKEVK